MKHYPAWSGIRSTCRVLALASPLLGLTIAAAPPASAATGTITVEGWVSCQSHAVEGVWVESGGGGSGWADWHPIDSAHGNIAWYQAKIQNTTLPTNIRLHIGCGGSTSTWLSTNETGSTSEAGGALTGSDNNLDAVCNETIPAPSNNENCWYGYASAAAAWAIQHLSAPGSTHAVTGDVVGNNPPVWTNWSGYCLVFADAGYWTNGESVSPDVTTDAADMYTTYNKDGLVHSASGVPPVGAFAFYPNIVSNGKDYGHIGISIGNGKIISANESSPSITAQGYNAGNLSGQYKGWAYPATAFR
jgi:hypothetical protein